MTWQGETVIVVERYSGTLEMQLPQGPRVGELRITRAWTRLCHMLSNGIRKSVSTLLGLESGYACVYQAVRISGDVLVETPRRGVFRGDACW